MKKKSIRFLFLAVLLIAALAVGACGKKGADDNTTPAETKEAVTKDETKTETQTETKEEKTEEATETQGGVIEESPSATQRVQITMTLIGKLQYVTKVGAGAVQIDHDIVYTDPATGFGYNLVTDPNIQSFYDIYQMLYGTFTNGCVDARWKFLVEAEPGMAPFFQLVQDESVPTGIYMVQPGSGYLDYTPTGDITTEWLDDHHFTARVPFEQFEQTMYLNLDIILEDDWKINAFSVED